MQQQLKAPILRISETRGHTVEAANKQTTPVGRVIQVSLPFASLTWHKTYRLPVYNATSRAIGAIVIIGLATVLIPFVIRTVLLRRRRIS